MSEPEEEYDETLYYDIESEEMVFVLSEEEAEAFNQAFKEMRDEQ